MDFLLRFSLLSNNSEFRMSRCGAGQHFGLGPKPEPRVLWVCLRTELWKCGVVRIAGGLCSLGIQQEYILLDLVKVGYLTFQLGSFLSEPKAC